MPPDFRAPAGQIGVATAKLPAHVERSQADTLERDGIEPNADLAFNGTNSIDAGNAAQTLQTTNHYVLDEP